MISIKERKKNMKKLIFVLACMLALTMAFVACKKGEGDANLPEESGTPEEIPTGNESTEAPTSEETDSDTTDTTTDSTTSEEPTGENMVADIMNRVDEAMDSVKYYELTHKETTKGEGTDMTYITISQFDGNSYYSCFTSTEEGATKVEYYLNKDLLLYTSADGKFVVNLTDKQHEYVLAQLFTAESDEEEGDSYNEMLTYFSKIELSEPDGGNCKYRIVFTEPTEEYFKLLNAATGDIPVEYTNVSITVNIASDYKVVSSSSSTAFTMMGMEIETITEDKYVYNLKVSFPSKINNSYKVMRFEDLFGYFDKSEGIEIGLDLSKDSFILDCKNSDLLDSQLSFIYTFPTEFAGKEITFFGYFMNTDDGAYVEFYHDNSVDVVLSEGLDLPPDAKMLRIKAELVPSSEYGYLLPQFQILSYEAIEHEDVPEGGFLPFTGFVTSNALNIRTSPSADDSKNLCGDLKYNDQVKVIGITENGWYIIEYKWSINDESGNIAYVNSKYVSKIPADYVNISNGQHVNAPV